MCRPSTRCCGILVFSARDATYYLPSIKGDGSSDNSLLASDTEGAYGNLVERSEVPSRRYTGQGAEHFPFGSHARILHKLDGLSSIKWIQVIDDSPGRSCDNYSVRHAINGDASAQSACRAEAKSTARPITSLAFHHPKAN